MREHPDQFTLAQLLLALKQAPQDHACRFDFCMTVPTNLDSYLSFIAQNPKWSSHSIHEGMDIAWPMVVGGRRWGPV